jgi:hypothetical protein
MLQFEDNFNECINHQQQSLGELGDKKNLIIIIIMFTPQNVGILVLGHEILVQIHYCHYCKHLL